MLRPSSLALVLLGLLAYCNALRHPFVHDDVIFILNNPHITEIKSWYGAFKVPMALGGLNTYYRPLLEVLYRLEYRFFGPHPFGFHLVNVIVHIINGLLLFRLLERLGLKIAVAWLVSCLFLIHPVQTEAVDCISGISNLWMGFWVLLALNAYLDKRCVLSVTFFVIACLGKEQGILFVPLIIVIDCYRKEENVRWWTVFILVTCVLMALRHAVTGASLFKDITASPGELILRLAAIPRDVGMYLRLIFFPYDLHYYRNTDILQPYHLAWVLFLISAGGIFYIFQRWPGTQGTLILGLGWFLAALLPVLNIVPLIDEYSFILTPEHFLYLPIIGILIIVVVAADYFLKSFKKALSAAVVIVCLLLTWHQNTFWRSEIVLFERMLRFEPDFGRGHLLLAKAYYFNGQPQLAQGHFEKALIIISSYARKASNRTARDFYLRYINQILFYQSLNEQALAAKGH